MRVLNGEAFFFGNVLLSGCVLPLGGKLAGVSPPDGRRLAAAACMAGALSVAGLWLPLLGPLSLPVCVWLAYRAQGRAAVRRCTLTTLCASLMTGGAATALAARDVAPWACVGGSLALEGAFYLLVKLLPCVMKEVRQVELMVGDRRIMLPAMVDSGNLMRDPVTSLPVLVIPLRAAHALYPEAAAIDPLRALPAGFRLLHVRTAAGSGLLPMFRPDRCWLYLDGRRQEARLLAAVAGQEYRGAQALVPLSAIRE